MNGSNRRGSTTCASLGNPASRTPSSGTSSPRTRRGSGHRLPAGTGPTTTRTT
jgi:hypothetical protein